MIRIVLQFVGFLLAITDLLKLLYFIRLRRYRSGLIAAALEAVCALVLWYETTHPAAAEESVMAVLMTALAVLSLENLRHLLHWRREHVTEQSVRESIELLPVGVCSYWEGGLPKLCNRKMNEICRALTGEHLFDAADFRQKLTEGGLPQVIEAGERPIAVLADGTAYSFVQYEGMLGGEKIYELIASDITEEYRLTAELREKQKHADFINLRLKATQSELHYSVMDRELLQIKTRVHDSLGETLLATKQYLNGTGSVDGWTLRNLWETNIRLLQNSEPEQFQRPYYIAMQRAEWLGVKLEITGRLPEDESLIPVIDTALTVHATNLLRHAEGKAGYITVTETADFYELCFTNDGKPPLNGIQETGGLQNLRRITEKAGGGMRIRALPRFELLLKLPKSKLQE